MQRAGKCKGTVSGPQVPNPQNPQIQRSQNPTQSSQLVKWKAEAAQSRALKNIRNKKLAFFSSILLLTWPADLNRGRQFNRARDHHPFTALQAQKHAILEPLFAGLGNSAIILESVAG